MLPVPVVAHLAQDLRLINARHANFQDNYFRRIVINAMLLVLLVREYQIQIVGHVQTRIKFLI